MKEMWSSLGRHRCGHSGPYYRGDTVVGQVTHMINIVSVKCGTTLDLTSLGTKVFSLGILTLFFKR